jgi:ubiquinone/menaquinone biosynthesis C-methylase UbiE
MTKISEHDERRQFVHGMWANVAAEWGAHAEDIDERSRPITERMLDAVGLEIGDRVLELASGAGGTGLAAAERVGADGEVVLSDVVPEMVEIAQRRARVRELGDVRTEVLDLENISEPDEAFDVVLCREGMMFALEPRRAVAEMHRVLRPGGRAAVAVWGPRSANPWLGVLLDAITEVTGIVVPPPDAPGPFALSDAAELRDLFADAGFDGLAVDRVSAPLRAPSFSAWWNRQLKVAGPVIAVVHRLDDATRTRLHDTARAAASRYVTNGALELPGLALVLTGRRS